MLAALIFANVIDGTTPQLFLYAIHFARQLVPVFAVMMIEGLSGGMLRMFFLVSRGVTASLFICFIDTCNSSILWGDTM
jgi:hypothetical protein